MLMVIDATEGVTEQDAKIAGIAHERGKGVIIVVNNGMRLRKTTERCVSMKAISVRMLSYMPYAEIMYVSASNRSKIEPVI